VIFAQLRWLALAIRHWLARSGVLFLSVVQGNQQRVTVACSTADPPFMCDAGFPPSGPRAKFFPPPLVSNLEGGSQPWATSAISPRRTHMQRRPSMAARAASMRKSTQSQGDAACI
jgi:hypothetical protein